MTPPPTNPPALVLYLATALWLSKVLNIAGMINNYFVCAYCVHSERRVTTTQCDAARNCISTGTIRTLFVLTEKLHSISQIWASKIILEYCL